MNGVIHFIFPVKLSSTNSTLNIQNSKFLLEANIISSINYLALSFFFREKSQGSRSFSAKVGSQLLWLASG